MTHRDPSSSLPISAQILTRNSGEALEKALQSLPPCREILIIDGGSTDETLEIAKRFGARILSQGPARADGALTDFSSARNVGLHAATQPWILELDSDESLSDALHEEVTTLARSSEPAAFFVPRRYVRGDGVVIQYATTYPNERIYFFHRDTVDAWIKPVHERVALKPGVLVRHLAGATLAPLVSVSEYKMKNTRYLAIEAAASRNRGWTYWLRHRVYRTLRARVIATIKLAWIWLIPRTGARLPLAQEWARYWYAWRLIVETYPGKSSAQSDKTTKKLQ